MRVTPFGFAALLLLAACPAKESAPEAPTTKEAAAPPPAIRVAADREDLVFSYPVEGGRRFETATSVGAIPEDGKKGVVVMDLSMSPEERQAGRYIYVADLTSENADGTFPVAVASRYGFEAKLTGTSTGGAASGDGVVVYSTSWCGACKKAKRLLKQWKVPFEDKDVEASASAQRELSAKAAAQGLRPSGVPVIDVAGTLLMGLDEATLKRTLQAKKLL